MKAFWEYFTLDSLIFTAMTCFLWRMISTSSSHSSTNLASCMAVLTWREKQQREHEILLFTSTHSHLHKYKPNHICYFLFCLCENSLCQFFYFSVCRELCKNSWLAAITIMSSLTYRAGHLFYHFILHSAHKEKSPSTKCAPELKLTCDF